MSETGQAPKSVSLAASPPLPRGFYDRDVVAVARALVGKYLVRTSAEGIAAGRIVEVEAYLAQNDPASHSFRGQTKRNASMFGPPGHAYVYTIHRRFCLNAVTERAGVASAVLIRAVEPLEGLDLMHARRHNGKTLDLARGPGRLCEAFAIDRQLDGWDLTAGARLWIADGPAPAGLLSGPRVGISSARDLPLRFYLANCRFVSRVGRAS